MAVSIWIDSRFATQDSLFKKVETFKFDKHLRKLKYIILLVFVIILPLFLVDILGQGSPYFCKLICPIGMLEGGLPLVLLNKSMRSAIGFLYYWKGIILIVTLLLSIIMYRPFVNIYVHLELFTQFLTLFQYLDIDWIRISVLIVENVKKFAK